MSWNMTQGEELDYEKQGISETKNLKFNADLNSQVLPQT